jgi:hypothetical protein
MAQIDSLNAKLTPGTGVREASKHSRTITPAYQAWQKLLALGALDQIVEDADNYIQELVEEIK